MSNISLSKLLCKSCIDCFNVLSTRTANMSGLGRVQLQAFPAIFSQRNICTTVSLQTKKNRQKKYVFKVPPFHTYGATHRLLRGASVTGENYGPIFDKPDYTFLDGRPTPLTPEQMEQKIKRREQADRVVRLLNEMEVVKSYYEQKKKAVEDHRENFSKKRLKAKS